MDSFKEVRNSIIHVCRRVYEHGMVASNDGNVTARVGDDRVLVTPTGMSKGYLSTEDLVLTDMDGVPVEDNGRKVTSEIKIYLKIYSQREDVRAAVHAHPLYATAYAACGRTVESRVLPESVLSLGEVPLVPYGTPGTAELAERIGEYLDGCEVFLLENHGALALGTDVLSAYHRMECLEHTARIIYLARELGEVQILSPERIGELFKVHGNKTSERIRRTGEKMSRT